MHKSLVKLDPLFKPLVKHFGEIPLPKSKTTPPYHALLRAIAYQQLHGKAAATIFGRFTDHYGSIVPEPAVMLRTRETTMRKFGFSGSKILALRDIAAHTISGTVPTLKEAKKLSDAELVERLCTIRGLGRWTVEMLLIFHLGRTDILPVDDFAVREGYKLAAHLPAQPKPKELWTIGERWAPHRTLASLYFWKVADAAKLNLDWVAKASQ